jgi:signal transduction histidine kinase
VRLRLTAVLMAVMSLALLGLGLPLALSVAAAQARTLHADRLADVALLAASVPPGTLPPTDDAGSALAGRLAGDLRRYDVLYGVAVAVVDSSGRVRLTSRAAPDLRPAVVRDAERTALAGRRTEPPDRLLPWDAAPLAAAEPVVRDGDVIGAVLSVSPTGDARRRVLARWAVIGAAELAALVAAGALAARLARWVLRPIGTMGAAAHQIAGGDLAARVPTATGPPELRRLGRTFNEMAEQVQRTSDAQRAFVADASHQLRNPLGALLVRLEGLRMHAAGRDPAGDAAVDRALEDGRHLAGTLESMLALSRAEAGTAAAGPVDVGAVLTERLESWRIVAQSRGITVRRAGADQAVARHDPAALAGALDAVLDNAVKYGPEGSVVTVGVRSRDGEVVVAVTDQGPGIPGAERHRAGDRFWRSPSSSDRPGTGLGLAIAGSLLERHGGRIDLAAAGSGASGLTVELVLPQGFAERK